MPARDGRRSRRCLRSAQSGLSWAGQRAKTASATSMTWPHEQRAATRRVPSGASTMRIPSNACHGCTRAGANGGLEVTAIGYSRGHRRRERRARDARDDVHSRRRRPSERAPGRARGVRRGAMGHRPARDREGGRRLPQPARHVAQGGFPRAVAWRAEPLADRDECGRHAAASWTTLHVDVAVLFPDNLLALPMVRDPRFALALAKAYNAWLCERWLSPEPTLRGALVACPQRPEESADDIRRHAGHRGVCCIYLPACGLRPLYGHHQYEPDLAGRDRDRAAGRDPLGRGGVPGVPVPARLLRDLARAARARAPALDGREPREHARDRRAHALAGDTLGLHGGRRRLGARGSPTGSTRSTSSAGARCRTCRSGRATTCAILLRHAADRGAARCAATSSSCSSCSTASTPPSSPPTGRTTTSTTRSTSSGCRSRPRRGVRFMGGNGARFFGIEIPAQYGAV